MTHIRQTIRNYVATQLTGATNAGANVYKSKVTPFWNNLPAINIFTMRDEAEPPFELGPVRQKVPVTIHIYAAVKHNDDYADNLDALCEQIESKMDYFLGGNVQSCLYDGTNIVFRDEGDKNLAIAEITYKATHIYEEKGMVNPDTLSDLDSIHIDYDLADPNDGSTEGPDGQTDAQDIVDNLQS